jgi:FAD/FMN-containing dehydrogenase
VISVTTISDRALSALVPILFDPASGEAERAHACYAELFATCQASGYLPYRGHVHHLDRYANPAQSKFWQAAQMLKEKLDPQKIMAPGRYDGQPAQPKKVKS